MKCEPWYQDQYAAIATWWIYQIKDKFLNGQITGGIIAFKSLRL
jgi:hypothetical protein